jgi:putative oxidoreductase
MAFRLFSSNPWLPNAIVIVRVILGLLISRHGLEVFEPGQMEGMIRWMKDDFDFPAPAFMTYLAKAIEFACGLLLAIGLFSRISSLLLAIVMGVIVFGIGKSAIFYDDEHPFLFCLFFVTFFIIGPGKISLDYLLFDRRRTKVND